MQLFQNTAGRSGQSEGETKKKNYHILGNIGKFGKFEDINDMCKYEFLDRCSDFSSLNVNIQNSGALRITEHFQPKVNKISLIVQFIHRFVLFLY